MLDAIAFLPNIELSKDIAGMMSFLLLFLGVSVAAGFLFGRNKLVNIFINIYIALAFTKVLPIHDMSDSPYAEILAFGGLLIFLTFIDEHLFDLHIPNSSYDVFWRMFVMSVLVVGMVVSVSVTLLPKKLLASSPFPFLFDFFGQPLAHILWLSVPILLLVFMNKRLR